MKYFLDTEFIESGPHKPIQLVSIGVVAENGWEYYAISSEYDAYSASDWVKENVFPHLGQGEPKSLNRIGRDLKVAIGYGGQTEKPEFWGYYSDYDWVVFCQIFGKMIDLPKGWPMFCRDLKQLCVDVGNPELPTQADIEHNALSDARWNKQVYDFLQEFKRGSNA